MRRAKLTISILLFAMLLFSAAGCAWIGDLLYDAQEAGEDPYATEPPAESTAAPASRSDDANPVFTFCMSFLNVYRRVSAGMLSDVLAQEDAELSRAYMRLSSDLALINECYATVGMLPYSSDTPAPFAGTLDGAYAGTGEISRDGSFGFELSGGGRITGSIEDGITLLFRRTGAGSSYDVVIFRSARGFTVRITEGRSIRYLELTRDGLRSVRLENAQDDSREPFFPESSGEKVFSYYSGKAGLSD